VQTSMRFWLGRKQKGVLCRVAGLVAAIALMQSGMPAAAPQSAQATASPTGPKGSVYALIPADPRVAAPDFTLTDLSGRTITLSQFRGKVVLLDFWAVECGGCKVEIPWYVAFDRTYRDKGLALIGIDMYGESPDVVRTFMAKAHMNCRVAIGNDALGEQFHVEEMPLTLLIDRSGRIALSHAGIVDKTQFESDIQELLQ
jgi:peroxiredoxin